MKKTLTEIFYPEVKWENISSIRYTNSAELVEVIDINGNESKQIQLPKMNNYIRFKSNDKFDLNGWVEVFNLDHLNQIRYGENHVVFDGKLINNLSDKTVEVDGVEHPASDIYNVIDRL